MGKNRSSLAGYEKAIKLNKQLGTGCEAIIRRHMGQNASPGWLEKLRACSDSEETFHLFVEWREAVRKTNTGS